MDTPAIIPVILSGGAGTRLWPMSTPERPKQFLALTGSETMFEQTLARCPISSGFSAPIIVGSVGHRTLIESQLANAGITGAQIILEPCARNTAPAIALAALAANSNDAPLLVMPSDHVIADLAAFRAAIAAALPHVEKGWLATFGITPTGPETGYGYIKAGNAIGAAVQRVDRFVEKPELDRAKAMLASGDHFWNGGIFLFRADKYLEVLATHAPDMLRAANAAMDGAVRDGLCTMPNAAAFAASPSDSIDYAVMEKANDVAVAPVDMGWSDVGSWDSLFDIGAAAGNGDVLALDSDNCLMRSDGIKIRAVGISDLIVIASGDEILLVPRGESQQVKRVVDALKAR